MRLQSGTCGLSEWTGSKRGEGRQDTGKDIKGLGGWAKVSYSCVLYSHSEQICCTHISQVRKLEYRKGNLKVVKLLYSGLSFSWVFWLQVRGAPHCRFTDLSIACLF